MNRRQFLKIGAAVPMVMTAAVDLAAKGTDKTVVTTLVADPVKRQRRGQLYVMAGEPKVGKTTLGQELKRRLPSIQVIETEDGWWSGRGRSIERTVDEQLVNGGPDILLITRVNRAGNISGFCSDNEWMLYKANLIFVLEGMGVSHFKNPPTRTWSCRQFMDRQDVYADSWVWESTMSDREFFAQQVKAELRFGG